MNQEFRALSSFDISFTSTQGLCFDGTYIYVAFSAPYEGIAKYTLEGTLVASRDTTSDGTNDHVGDLMVKDGILYVTCSAYPSTPYNEFIKEYNASDLSYRNVEYATFTDHIGEGIDYKDGYFWTVSDNFDEVYKWETGFTSPTTYPITEPTITGTHHFQTLVWVDDYLYMNTHENTTPAHVQKYYFNGTNFEFLGNIARPDPQIYATQGMAYDSTSDKFFFAIRGYGVVSDAVVTAKLVDNSSLLTSSDLDAFRSDGTIYTDSITFSGTLAASSSQSQTSTGISVSNLDFYQILFDNSVHSPSKFRDLSLENATFVTETTGPSELVVVLRTNVSAGVLTVTGTILNEYSTTRTLQTTTINLRLVPYDSTLL